MKARPYSVAIGLVLALSLLASSLGPIPARALSRTLTRQAIKEALRNMDS